MIRYDLAKIERGFNMKKKDMEYRKKIAAIIALVTITAACTCSLVLFGITGVPIEKIMPIAKYSCIAEISCTPILKEGVLYKAGNIEFGDNYITSCVDKLSMNFNYNFESSNASDIAGSYRITAKLLGVYNNTVVWEKEYLLENRQFTGNKTAGAKTLWLSTYRDFVAGMEKETELRPDVIMTVSYDVDISALVQGKSVNETTASTLQFPLNASLMNFSGKPVSKVEKTIDDVAVTEIRMENELLIANIAALALTLSLLIYVLFFTVGRKYDPAQRQLDKIFKYYGNRIVDLKPNSSFRTDNLIAVNSFKDLLLIADELKKPILKTGNPDFRQTSFFVIDEPFQYVFYARFLADKQPKELIGYLVQSDPYRTHVNQHQDI